MVSVYKQPGSAVWWVSYYRNGRRIRESLQTCDERIAKKRVRRIEAELVTGDLDERTTTPLVPLLEAFSAAAYRRSAATHCDPAAAHGHGWQPPPVRQSTNGSMLKAFTRLSQLR